MLGTFIPRKYGLCCLSWAVLLAFHLTLPAFVSGQAFTGSLSGLVTDPSGAPIPQVAITVTDVNRNVNISSTTNQDGFYSVSPLPPGTYRVRAEKEGFRQYVLDTLNLSAQQKAGIDIALQVGAVSESVEVTAEAQLLQTNSSELSTVTDNRQIANLPLNGRNVQSLVLLTPGVTGMTANGGTGESFESQGRFVVNGGRDSTTAIQLDGVSVDMPSYIPGTNFYSAVPSAEGIQEFRVQTNAFSAEYGRTGGGIVTMVTKSGTNAVHGSVYEFFRNSVLDANSFFNNARNVQRGSFKRNEFGATMGAPIVIPKLYDGRNRSFIFLEYQGRQQSSSATNVATLPTELERMGDFSNTRNAAGQVITNYNPFSTREDPNRPGQFIRDPFPGNRIPQNLLNPVALAAQKYFPSANRGGLPFTNQQNYVELGALKDSLNRGTMKFDHVINDRQRFFVRYTILNWNNAQPQMWGAGNPGCPEPYCVAFYQRQQNGALDYTNALTPTTILNISYGFARGILDRGSTHAGFRPSSLGLPASIEEGADNLLFPQFTGTTTTLPGVQTHWNFRTANMVHSVQGNITKIAGKHTFKFGVDTRAFLINQAQGTYAPIFQFSPAQTQGPDPRVAATSSGFDYASFLLGVGSSGSLTKGIRPAVASNYTGLFLQDDFKVNRKLTVNLGVRWDIEGGTRERYGRLSVFNPEVRSPLSDRTGLNLRGGYEFPESVHPTVWGNIAPRVGFAYQISSNTVIRAGYGMFYGVPPFSGVFAGPMYTAQTQWVTATGNGVTPFATLSNPYPNGYNQYEGSQNGLLAAAASSVGAPVISEMKVPYNQQWNFSIQQTIFENTLLDVAYAGNKGTHLPLSWQQNQLDPSLISPAASNTLVPNPFFGIIPTGALAQERIAAGQLQRPFPQYDSVSYTSTASGNSNYHSLQVKVQQRLARGANAMLAYTFSKTIDDGGSNSWQSAGNFRNVYCRACERGLSIYDMPHRIVANFTYELPFGRGKAIGANWNGFVDTILGGWQTNGILTYNSARPLVFEVITNTSNSFGGGQHPNTTGVFAGLPSSERTIARWFDTSQFSLPAPYTFGNLGRTSNLRGDAFKNIDFSVFKNFRILEGLDLQFRAESFNLLNQVVLGAPNTTVGSATFGQVTGGGNSPRQIQFGLKILF
jgi:hypothetical protein